MNTNFSNKRFLFIVCFVLFYSCVPNKKIEEINKKIEYYQIFKNDHNKGKFIEELFNEGNKKKTILQIYDEHKCQWGFGFYISILDNLTLIRKKVLSENFKKIVKANKSLSDTVYILEAMRSTNIDVADGNIWCNGLDIYYSINHARFNYKDRKPDSEYIGINPKVNDGDFSYFGETWYKLKQSIMVWDKKSLCELVDYSNSVYIVIKMDMRSEKIFDIYIF